MKVVINKCYGGFGLSEAGIMRYAELKGIKLYSWVDQIAMKVYGGDAQKAKGGLFIHYSTVPVADGSESSPEGTYFSEYDLKRDDPALIRVVEEMGEQANGRCAELHVVEIPDGIEYEIEEYDGMEWVAESHRTWR